MSAAPLTLIINPTAGRGQCGRALPAIRKSLEKEGTGATYLFTAGRGDAERLASEAIEAGASLVVAVGGDGTLHEVANAVIKSKNESATLGLIPFGTGNDFARAVGLYKNLDQACQALTQGRRAKLDVGSVTGAGLASPYYFLVAAGAGFVADTAKTVNENVRWLSGASAYVWGALCTLRSFEPLQLTIQIDNHEPARQDLMLVSVSNVATTGGGMLIAPGAVPDDGSLDICLVGKIGKMELVRQLPGVFSGRHTAHPAVSLLRAQRIVIDSEKPAALWIDGEVIGSTPSSFTVVPQALPMMLPNK